jgi:hypothetical protein
VGFAGVTLIEISVAVDTLRVAVPLTEPEVAVIVAVPPPTPDARPFMSMLATEFGAALQVSDVSNWVLPSSKLPVAVNCCCVPAAIVGVAGLTAIEVKCAATTVSVEESVNEPNVAVMVVWPAPAVVTSPDVLTVATDVEEELQVTPLLRSELDPSL